MTRRKPGLTIIEVVITLGILAIAALGLIAAMTRLMMAQSSSSHQTVARLIAGSLLEDAALAVKPESGLPSLYDNVIPKEARVGQNSELVEYSCEVKADLVNPPLELKDPSKGFNDVGEVWEVTVRVWWHGSQTGPEGGPERGTRTVTLTKLVYAET
jgi:hypothetical protein